MAFLIIFTEPDRAALRATAQVGSVHLNLGKTMLKRRKKATKGLVKIHCLLIHSDTCRIKMVKYGAPSEAYPHGAGWQFSNKPDLMDLKTIPVSARKRWDLTTPSCRFRQ